MSNEMNVQVFSGVNFINLWQGNDPLFNFKIKENMKKVFILFLMLWSSIFMYAQHLSITGKITDKQGEPIIGASVLVKGTSNGVITDLNGVFNMKDVPANGLLTISYIGYKEVESIRLRPLIPLRWKKITKCSMKS